MLQPLIWQVYKLSILCTENIDMDWSILCHHNAWILMERQLGLLKSPE